MRETDGWRGHVVRLLLLVSQPLMSVALSPVEDAPPPVRSTRGVQHKDPLISDDFVVGCIMIMFLLLFASASNSIRAAWTCTESSAPARENAHGEAFSTSLHTQRQLLSFTALCFVRPMPCQNLWGIVNADRGQPELWVVEPVECGEGQRPAAFSQPWSS
eukprot:CAMPEP_0181220114 /NCGR_PEP_ID=MMETSP1096-20121128/28659_1 /TAXON_ID=156174 ORGANISM="Chrysochromulina ericina, Strain CCMP281" /NCGR_SAMPLE_ID=MMETSP1096 /ASSEMBLY_ACC=CAM_ASM_000453 /LENGTH=159 /DNA_ID=CAMNT_0023312585 /DNA_START=36 /DNA_END=517 /DNA_ORIENTATION=+